LAELKIHNWEQEQLKKRRKYDREEAAEKFKKGAYQVGDAVVGFLGSLVELPDRIKEASHNIQQAPADLVESVETTIETVKGIPLQVKEQAETSVETTKKVVQEVQAIPKKSRPFRKSWRTR
jgi:methyl-accepting chemotaxis protein